jgi:hypothetical protein
MRVRPLRKRLKELEEELELLHDRVDGLLENQEEEDDRSDE